MSYSSSVTMSDGPPRQPWQPIPPGQPGASSGSSAPMASAPLLGSSYQSPGGPYRALEDQPELGGSPSGGQPPLESKLWSLDIPNTEGLPYAKDWLWMTRDQIGLGLVRYPFRCWFWRFLYFLRYVLFFGCLCSKDKEEVGGPRVVKESSFLLFTSRVDYVTIDAFTCAQEKLRFYLPSFWSADKPQGWFGSLVWWPLGIAIWWWRQICWAWEWYWATEFGLAFLMLLATGASFGVACNAAGLNGNPDYFLIACCVCLFVILLDIFALVWHCWNRSFWNNAIHPTPVQKTQADRWTVVMVFWALVSIFLIIALIAGSIFIRHEYDWSNTWYGWSPRQNLMCDSWDQSLGYVKPHPWPIQPPLPPLPVVGPAPPAPVFVRVVNDQNALDLMFTQPWTDSNVVGQITYNGTATIIGTAPPFPPFPMPTQVNPIYATNSNVIVGVRFSNLYANTTYQLAVSTHDDNGYSLLPMTAIGTTSPICPVGINCNAPQNSPTITSVVQKNAGDPFAFVTVSPPAQTNPPTPEVAYFTVYVQFGSTGQWTAMNSSADFTQPLQVNIQEQFLPDSGYVGFYATASNIAPGGGESAPNPQLVQYQIFYPAPSGVENMCSKVQRSTLITFMFCMAVVFVLLIILCWLTCVCFPKRNYAKLTLHGKSEYGFPLGVLLEVHDARQIETLFTNISRGHYFTSLQYPQAVRANVKLD